MFTKKSKLYLAVITATFSFLLLSCSAVISPLPVGIYSSAKFPLDFETGYDGDQKYIVLGNAVGEATATSILGLFASGDASIATAYQNAINQFPEADRLMEIKIDYSTNSVLGLFASMTTVVKGKAIQFQQPGFTKEKKKEETAPQKPGVRESEKNNLKIDTSLGETETVDLPKQYTDEELLLWQKMIRNALNNQPYSRLWKNYSNRNSISISKAEWANSLTKVDYHKYITSKMPFDKWLEKILEK